MTSPGSSQKPLRDPRLIISGVDEHLQVVLCVGMPEDAHVVAAVRHFAPSRANPLLAPVCKGLLDMHGLSVADLAGIAAVRGPGAFTGIRMTLAFVQGLTAAAPVSTAGLDHLPLLAAAPLAMHPKAHVLVLTHSRTRQVYAQIFHGETLPLDEVRALSLEEAVESFHSLPKPAFALGGGLRRNEAFFRRHLDAPSFLPASFDVASPDVLARSAVAAKYSLDDIEPLYLRASDAEDNLPDIAAKRGLDPAEAEKMLKSAVSRPVS